MALVGFDQIGQSHFGEHDVIEGDIPQNFEKRLFRLRKQEAATEVRPKRCEHVNSSARNMPCPAPMRAFAQILLRFKIFSLSRECDVASFMA